MKISKESHSSFCILPWVHLWMSTSGEWSCCCQASGSIGTVDQSIEQVWNSPKAMHMRLKMLKGEPLEQCKLCYMQEKGGMTSLRNWANLKWRHHIRKVNDTEDDGSVSHPAAFLSVAFSNLCNFRCRMCDHQSSSGWYEDAVSLGNICGPKVIDPWSDNEAFWCQMREEVLPSVEEICFAGGEPLIQESHYRMLRLLLEIGRIDVRLDYNTNLSTLKYKGLDLLELWREFEAVSVRPSTDGVGKRGEYIRKGLAWERWLENVQQLGTYLKSFSVAVSVYNVYHYLDLYFALQTKFPGIHPRGNLVVWPRNLSIRIFDQEMKKRIESRYAAFVKQNGRLPGFVTRDIVGWMDYMISVDASHQATAFKEYNSKLDELRGESFCDTFPELAEWYERI